MPKIDYSWMYTASSKEIEFYFRKEEKLQLMRNSALEALLKIHFGSKGYSFNFLDCSSGGFFDVTIYGNGIYEQFVVKHESMFDDVKKIEIEIGKMRI